jgi:hypothetical protein
VSAINELSSLIQAEIRQFVFPLNVYAELLRLETGTVDYLHYGLFASANEPVHAAQTRSTEWVFGHLPKPPARVLEVGIGLGTTLDRLIRTGFDAQGITPDAGQARIARARNPRAVVTEGTFESFRSSESFDLLLFQESSQYIDSRHLWEQADALLTKSAEVMVLDEFRLHGDGGLHSLARFIAEAERSGFLLYQESDHTAAAAHTVDYLLDAVSRHEAALLSFPGVSREQLAQLQASNRYYQQAYATGDYAYRFLAFRRAGKP